MIRRVVLPLLVGMVLAGLVAGAAFAALQLLPRPAPGVALGNRIAETISSLDAVRGVERVGSRRVRTTCRRLSGQRYLLTVAPNHRFVIEGATLTPLEAKWHRGEVLAIEVALAGCPSLLTSLLARLVLPAFLSSARLPVYATTFGHVHVYRISLTNRLELVADRQTLAPLAMRFADNRIGATSVLFGGGATKGVR